MLVCEIIASSSSEFPILLNRMVRLGILDPGFHVFIANHDSVCVFENDISKNGATCPKTIEPAILRATQLYIVCLQQSR